MASNTWHQPGFPARGATDWQILLKTAIEKPDDFIQDYPNDLHDDYLWIIAKQRYRSLGDFLVKLRSCHPVGEFDIRSSGDRDDVFSNTFGKAIARAGEKFGNINGYRWDHFEPKGGWGNAYTWRKDGCPEIKLWSREEKKQMVAERKKAREESQSKYKQHIVQKRGKRQQPAIEDDEHDNIERPTKRGRSNTDDSSDNHSQYSDGDLTLCSSMPLVNRPLPSNPVLFSQPNLQPTFMTGPSSNNSVTQEETSDDNIDPRLLSLSTEFRSLPPTQMPLHQLPQGGTSHVQDKVQIPNSSRSNSHGIGLIHIPSQTSVPSQPPPFVQGTSHDPTPTAPSISRDLEKRIQLMRISPDSAQVTRANLAKLEGQKSLSFAEFIEALDQFRSGSRLLIHGLGPKGHNFLEWSYFSWPSVNKKTWKMYIRFIKLLHGHPALLELIQTHPRYRHLTTVRIRSLSCAEEFYCLVAEADRKKSGVDTNDKMKYQLLNWNQSDPYPFDSPPVDPLLAPEFDIIGPKWELDLEKYYDRFKKDAEAQQQRGLFSLNFLKQFQDQDGQNSGGQDQGRYQDGHNSGQQGHDGQDQNREIAGSDVGDT